ncbi:MAG TPA: PfkB family carbohydrate kinase [Anaerolineaceae bacterium]|nr:PfkB family carbohydrate kinase [Anaerolineaceae bacterium]
MTNHLKPIEPIDYLIVGHITQDVVPDGYVPGGTASYSSLTAHAFGLRVGILTSYAQDVILPDLKDIQIVSTISENSTVFDNKYTKEGRVQKILSRAEILHPNQVPQTWANPKIVHIGPIADEVDPSFIKSFPNSFVGVTPQGWYRTWDTQGKVSFTNFIEARHYLQYADAVILSIEDLQNNESIIADLVYGIKVLVITEGSYGARVYWNGDVRTFRAPEKEESDATGAGDIFAAAFFIRMAHTKDPWTSARFATHIAANSVTRKAMDSPPKDEEIQKNLIEIIQN